METIKVIIPYTPRDVFKDYHDSNKRFSLTVAHRRAGKTVARVNKLIKEAALNTLENPRYGYIAPYYVQAKDIAWLYLKSYSAPILDNGGKVNESELSVTFAHNGAQIRLYGADNADRLRGLYFDGLAADEAQDIRPNVLSQIIMPTLVDRQGWLDLSGTPKGWNNLLGKTFKTSQNDPDWYVQVLKASETCLIAQDELAALKRAMPENEYLQEFECSFDAAITGAYFAASIVALEADGKITSCPYDPAMLVHTAWDLGISDSMVIWFFQIYGKEIRLIDYYEAAGYGLDHYAGELNKRPYKYGQHFAPHDIEARELGTGKSRLEIAQGLGIRFEVLPPLSIKDGIDAARMLIMRCVFDATKCAIGIDALRQYRENIDEKRGISLGPRHDWSSHAADAFRYLATAIDRISGSEWGKPIKYSNKGIV